MTTLPRWANLAIGVVLVLLVGGPTWNLAASKWTHRNNPVPGAFYVVNGHQMHIHCTGSGSPTVVLEAAASASWLAWRRMQPQLSPLTRVCSYDRAGHGWSDPHAGSRDADNIVGELHELLNRAGVQRPLVLVGHSAGGLYVREYVRRFPTEVAGVALLDSSTPQQLDALPGWRAAYEENRRDSPARLRWETLRVWSGWERLMGRCSVDSSGENPEIVGQYAALMCRPAFVGGEDNEYAYFEETSRQAARLATVGRVPLLVISRDPAAEKDSSPESVAQEHAWDQEQERIKDLSPLSWRVVARGSGHAVHHARLELVVAELTLLIQHLRGGPAPPFGTTAVK
jgi:pimeloyl-ACP methyl ester carboxylesterase